MHLPRRLVALASLSLMVALVACSSDEDSSSSASTILDATSPFACTTTGVGAWPIPGEPALEALRVAIGVDTLTASPVTDAAAPSLYTDDAAEYGALNRPRFVLSYTKGGTNGAIRTLDELRALIPVIDGPAKAYFWAEANGWRVECKTNWYGATAAGQDLAVSRLKETCAPRETAILRIAKDGTVTPTAMSTAGDAGTCG